MLTFCIMTFYCVYMFTLMWTGGTCQYLFRYLECTSDSCFVAFCPAYRSSDYTDSPLWTQRFCWGRWSRRLVSSYLPVGPWWVQLGSNSSQAWLCQDYPIPYRLHAFHFQISVYTISTHIYTTCDIYPTICWLTRGYQNISNHTYHEPVNIMVGCLVG